MFYPDELAVEIPDVDGLDALINSLVDPDDYIIESHDVDDFDNFGEIPYIE